MNVQALLDAAKERAGLANDSQLAAALGVSRQAVSSWRHQLKTPDPVACQKIATLTGEPLARVLGMRLGRYRARKRPCGAVWRRRPSWCWRPA
jgi:transcriptional regulator with XRE-family HTH domain